MFPSHWLGVENWKKKNLRLRWLGSFLRSFFTLLFRPLRTKAHFTLCQINQAINHDSFTFRHSMEKLIYSNCNLVGKCTVNIESWFSPILRKCWLKKTHWFKKKDPEKHNSAHKCVYNVATHKGNFLIWFWFVIKNSVC